MSPQPAPTQQLDELIADGREAVLDGDRERARELLEHAVERDPHSDEAWVWLAGAHSDPRAMAACLTRALQINPHNEQAQEGAHWLAREYGIQVDQTMQHSDPATHAAPPATHRPTLTTRHVETATHRRAATTDARAGDNRGGMLLLEAALHPFAVGAILGLLRLMRWLWPSTLVLIRGDAGPLGFVDALVVALAAAVLHGLAFVPGWAMLGWQIARVRSHQRGDVFDSLVRAGAVAIPAYLWGGALLLGAIGLRVGPANWRLTSLISGALLILGALLVAWRLWQLLIEIDVSAMSRRRALLRLLLITVVATLPGLILAGIAVRSLLT